MIKRNYILIIIAILAVLAGGLYLLMSDNDVLNQASVNPAAESNTIQPSLTGKVSTAATPTTQAKGIYVDYSEAVFNDSIGVKVLFFHAPWCRQCQMIETDIKSEGVPSGVTVLKVDYDTSTQLRKKYGVTLQTTFVRVTNTGELIKKFVAYDEPTFASVKQNIL